MCNDCSCSSIDLCSIVGMQPIGYCCSKCELDVEINPSCAKANRITVRIEEGARIMIKKAASKEKAETPEIQH